MKDEQWMRLMVKLKRELGDTIMGALGNPSVLEIMLNPDGKLLVEEFGKGKQQVGTLTNVQAESIVNTVAAMLNTTVGYDRPGLEGELPIDTSRFTALLPPVVAATSFTIRRKATKIFTLGDYLQSNIITQKQHDVIIDCIKNKKNIVVAGGTSSGKTTLLNAVINGISVEASHDRLVIIEDTGEVQCSASDFVTMRAVGNFTMNDCLKKTMRFRPDRIIVGEVRGGEAMALLKSWNTGHEGGAATIHANSASLALLRMQSLIAEAPEASNYTPDMIKSLIGEAVHVIIFICKDKEALAGRRISEIVKVEGYDAISDQYRITSIQ